jgi:hypothetical protein
LLWKIALSDIIEPVHQLRIITKTKIQVIIETDESFKAKCIENENQLI